MRSKRWSHRIEEARRIAVYGRESRAASDSPRCRRRRRSRERVDRCCRIADRKRARPGGRGKLVKVEYWTGSVLKSSIQRGGNRSRPLGEETPSRPAQRALEAVQEIVEVLDVARFLASRQLGAHVIDEIDAQPQNARGDAFLQRLFRGEQVVAGTKEIVAGRSGVRLHAVGQRRAAEPVELRSARAHRSATAKADRARSHSRRISPSS